jgi:dTDP-4-dehydrorhamnose reductase
MKKILLIGGSGQLGTDLDEAIDQSAKYDLISLDHSMIELKDEKSVITRISEFKPDVVINCGAYVRVDDCEDNAEEAIHINSIGAAYVARASADVKAVCVYISTDYVFDGYKNTPYSENDPAYPINIYGISKLSGEHMVRSYCPDHFIIRSSGLYGLAGSSGKGGNFVETIIQNAEAESHLYVVDDQILTPTFTKDLAKSILILLESAEYGTYHITNSGQCSWYLFAKKILELKDLESELTPTSSEQYAAKAKRPSYSVLSKDKLMQSGIDVPRPWEQALEEYISLRP